MENTFWELLKNEIQKLKIPLQKMDEENVKDFFYKLLKKRGIDFLLYSINSIEWKTGKHLYIPAIFLITEGFIQEAYALLESCTDYRIQVSEKGKDDAVVQKCLKKRLKLICDYQDKIFTTYSERIIEIAKITTFMTEKSKAISIKNSLENKAKLMNHRGFKNLKDWKNQFNI